MTRSAHRYPKQLHPDSPRGHATHFLIRTPSGRSTRHSWTSHSDDSIFYPDVLSRLLTSAAIRWCVRTPCPDIFAMDSKELSSISDCFGDKKAIKTPKLNTIWLELIAMVLNMLIGLKGDNYYSKMFIRVNYKLWNITFWVVITPPNRHIASPLAMNERKIKINRTIIYNIMLIKNQFSSGMMI